MEPGIELGLVISAIVGVAALIRWLTPEPGPRRRSPAVRRRPEP
jgi:hypothetical protein